MIQTCDRSGVRFNKVVFCLTFLIVLTGNIIIVAMETKALIFDLGKVVFDLSFDRTFESWAKSSGKTVQEIRSGFAFDETFDMFERGEISPAQFRRLVSEKLRMEISDEEFDKGWCDLYLEVYSGMDDLLFQLSRKYQIVALTNTNEIHYKVWPIKYEGILKRFEIVFSSHLLNMRKPEERIYNFVLDQLQLRPEEAVFLDDNPHNVTGARKVGIQSILVTSREQMRTELKRLEILF